MRVGRAASAGPGLGRHPAAARAGETLKVAKPPQGRKDAPSKPMRVRGAAFDLRKTGISRYDMRDPYHFAVTLSWGAFAIGMLVCILIINVVFALLYLAEPGAVQNLNARDFLSAFFFSLETLATVGYGEMAPATFYGHSVAGVEIIVGMAFTAIMTGLLFVRFSRPKAKILFADSIVVSTYNSKPTLMLRIANGRFSMLTHASAKIGILLGETSHEGQLFRAVHDLKLTRTEIPIFPLTWTLMHVIDASSPLHGLGPEALEEGDARFFLTVEARDPDLGAQVQVIHDYDYRQVVFGMRYADAVSRNDEGQTTADLSRLSLLEPENDPREAPEPHTRRSGGMT
jgi:inward rectifier potassium channel